MKKISIVYLVGLIATLSLALAEDLDSGLARLSDGLAAAVSKSGTKKISVIDFTDLQGNSSELGRYLAEQLSVSLVNSSKDFSVMDRANLKSLLDEHKLTASGLVNPENAKKVGQFAGVDAIVLGTITPFGESLTVTARAIATETSQVVAGAKVSISRSKDIDALLIPEPAPKQTGASAKPSGQDGQTKTENPAADAAQLALQNALRIDVNSQQQGQILAKVESIRGARDSGAGYAVATVVLVNRDPANAWGVMVCHPGYDYTYARLTDSEGHLFKIDANGVNNGGVTGVLHDYNNTAFTEIAPNGSAKMVLRFRLDEMFRGTLKPPFRLEFILLTPEVIDRSGNRRRLEFLIEVNG